MYLSSYLCTLAIVLCLYISIYLSVMKIGNMIYLLLHVLINSSLENEISDYAYMYIEDSREQHKKCGPWEWTGARHVVKNVNFFHIDALHVNHKQVLR